MKTRNAGGALNSGIDGAYMGAPGEKNFKNGAYLGALEHTPRDDEKFALEYGESLVEGDIRAIIIKNYDKKFEEGAL